MRIALLLVLLLTAFASTALAHGIAGHRLATDEGIRYNPDCDMQKMLLQPKVRNALQIGANFPDSGYSLDEGRFYGETAHWAEYHHASLEHIRANLLEPYSMEDQQKIAFFIGGAAHGLEDEYFDTIFLDRVCEKDPQACAEDGDSQDQTDTGTDAFLVVDGHTYLTPELYFPLDDIIAVFSAIDAEVDPEVVSSGMGRIRVAIRFFPDLAVGWDEEFRPQIPWASTVYLDESEPGTIGREFALIGQFQAALWKRIRGEYEHERDLIIHSDPRSDERLLSNSAETYDSRAILTLAMGARNSSINSETVKVFDASGDPVDVEVKRVRWGGPDDYGRMVMLTPMNDWRKDHEYTISLGPGIEFVDGSRLDNSITTTFRSACDNCEPLPAAEAISCGEPDEAPGPNTEVTEVSAAPDKKNKKGCAVFGDTALGAEWLLLLLAFGTLRGLGLARDRQAVGRR